MGECYQVRGCVTCVDVEACGGTPLAVAVPIVDCGGTPLAITEVEAPGWTVAAQIRVNAHSATLLHQLDATITPGEEAEVALRADATDTQAWAAVWPRLRVGWDLLLTAPGGGGSWALAAGKFTVRPGYTR